MSVILDLSNIELMDFLGKQESQFIEKPSHFTGVVKERMLLGIEGYGDRLPWDKASGFRLRPSEVTVWVGINGHGKSAVLGMIAAYILPVTTVCVASLEMTPASTLERMIKQSAGSGTPTMQYVDQWMEAVDGSLYIYDQLDSLPSDRILAMCHYAAHQLGVKHLVIDSLMKCGVGEEDYQGQGDFVDKLCWIAKQYNIHIHLIHHVRKGSDETKLPDKFDVKGSSRITDMVDNLVIVHRNKAKEKKIEAGKEYEELEPDTRLIVAKQRHGEWEGTISLYFNRASGQFLSGPDSRTINLNLEMINAKNFEEQNLPTNGFTIEDREVREGEAENH